MVIPHSAGCIGKCYKVCVSIGNTGCKNCTFYNLVHVIPLHCTRTCNEKYRYSTTALKSSKNKVVLNKYIL